MINDNNTKTIGNEGDIELNAKKEKSMNELKKEIGNEGDIELNALKKQYEKSNNKLTKLLVGKEIDVNDADFLCEFKKISREMDNLIKRMMAISEKE
ncbi:MAG: hypothetical protein LBK08_02015 [Treponema sp.]|jgi:acetolactate synthase small subunit|nr:hypothetical protein [Treponema sp.]